MKQVAVVTAVGFTAALAVIFLALDAHERAADRAQAQAQHEELIRHFDELEQRVASALSRTSTARADGPRASSIGAAISRATRAQMQTVPAADASPEQRAQHEESIQAGNSIIDRAIQSGRWTADDVIAFDTATLNVSGPEHAELMARLAAAINSNQVNWEVH